MFRSFAHFLIELFVFGVELYDFFINFVYEPLIEFIIDGYVLTFGGVPFHFVDGFLFYAKLFILV